MNNKLVNNAILSLSVLFVIGVLIISNINFDQGKTELPGIQISEQETEKGKIITVSAPDELNYENVLGYTELSKEVSAEKIHLYHLTEQGKREIEIEKYDKNNNGLIDYIKWNVPHLSTQTYELIIKIIDAEHLDENKIFISNIYEYVNETDNITYSIPENQYIRAYFETDLINKNVIDIYVRNTKPATIEVYEKDSEVVVGKIENVLEGIYYISLTHSGSQNVFDLKSVGGEIVYDYVHDEDANINWTPPAVYFTTGVPLANCPANSLDAPDDAVPNVCDSGASSEVGDIFYINSTHIYSFPGDTISIDSAWACAYFDITGKLDDDANSYVTVNIAENTTGDWVYTEYDRCVGNVNCSGWEGYAYHCYDIYATIGDNITKASAIQISIFAYNADGDNNEDILLDYAYVNISYTQSEPENTCTEPESGNWAITCSDNCTWTEDFTVPDNITITGSGTLIWKANMTMNSTINWQIYKNDGCEMVINPGGSIR